MAGGFRLPVTEHQGPVIRAGAFGYLRGNDAFYASLLELPQVQLGYQYQRGRLVIELGGTSGAVLTGRQRLGETYSRHLGSGLEFGGYAAMHLPWVRLGASFMRLPTSDALGSKIDVAEGSLCAIARPMAICADVRSTQNDALTYVDSSRADVRSIYAGLSFGLTQ